MLRAALVLLLAAGLLLGCGGGPSEVFEVEVPTEGSQQLFVHARVTSAPHLRGFRVLRTVDLVPGPDGALHLLPRTVHTQGDVQGDDGAFRSGHIGVDRAEQAISNPDLAPFWAAARAKDTRLERGYPTLARRIHSPARSDDRFDPWCVPDLLLPAVLFAARGAWALGQTRDGPLTLPRGAGVEPWTGRLVLDRRSGADWTLMLAVDARFGGSSSVTSSERIERRVSGFVVLGQNGRVESANLEADTWRKDAAGRVLRKARHLVEIRSSRRDVTKDQARAFAALLDLRERDPAAFQARLRTDTAAHALELVGYVRPDADLEAGMRAPDALPTSARRVAMAWQADLATFLPARAVAPEIDLPAPLVADLQRRAHELTRRADARIAGPDLARLGLGGPDPDAAWVDLDGVLAAAALEAATARTRGWAAYFRLDDEGRRSHLMHWILAGGPEPRLDPVLLDAARGTSNRLLTKQRRPGDALAGLLDRTWDAFTYQTRELLFPASPTEPSRLFPLALALRTRGAIGATRVGAWTAGRVEALVDDVLVKGENGLLWLTHWETEAAARRFAAKHSAEVRGRHVTLTRGDLPHLDAWLRVLLAP